MATWSGAKPERTVLLTDKQEGAILGVTITVVAIFIMVATFALGWSVAIEHCGQHPMECVQQGEP